MSLLLYLNMDVLANTTFFLIVPLKSARCRQIYHSFPRSRQSARQGLFAELKLHLLFLTPITYLFLTVKEAHGNFLVLFFILTTF